LTATTGEALIRPGRREDAFGLAETAIAAWRAGFRGIVPEQVDPAATWRPERIAERLAGRPRDGSAILTAEVDGEVRGLSLYGPSRDRGAPPREGEIIALYVHPLSWRRGIGRGLVEASLDWLARDGHAEAIVWTLAASPRNLAFYEALGLVRDGATQRRPSFGNPLEVRFRTSLAGRRASRRSVGSAAARQPIGGFANRWRSPR
jgi:GNAT superfamily N-acetyltransferase